MVYKFAQAQILLGLPPTIDDFQWIPIIIASKKELNALMEEHHWDGTMETRAIPVHWARMLAKIGYSYAVAEIGFGSFRPLQMTRDVIRNRTDNVSYSVGGDMEIPPPDPEGNHLLEIILRNYGTTSLIVVEIRLFPGLETPQYRVVVGDFDFQNPQHVRAFSEKVSNAKEIKPFLPFR